MNGRRPIGLTVPYRPLSKKKKLSETTARTTIGMMRSIASKVPISPFHLMAADEMESLLEEVLKHRQNAQEK
jgi:hypothetical protein